MLISIIEVPRQGNQSHRTKKLIQLKCDECNCIFERRWQKKETENLNHWCSRKCVYLSFSKNEKLKTKISISTKKRMQDPDVRLRHETAIKKRSTNDAWKQNISKSRKKRYKEDFKFAEKQRIRIKDWYSIPENLAKFTEQQNKPELREFRKNRAIKFWSIEENKKNLLLGSNNPMSGTVSPWWKSWMTKKREAIEWAKTIIRLCDFKCLLCGSNIKLEAHHIAPRATHPELSFDLSNGIALCVICHRGSNNKENVHAILRTDKNQYKLLMKKLLLERKNVKTPSS